MLRFTRFDLSGNDSYPVVFNYTGTRKVNAFSLSQQRKYERNFCYAKIRTIGEKRVVCKHTVKLQFIFCDIHILGSKAIYMVRFLAYLATIKKRQQKN